LPTVQGRLKIFRVKPVHPTHLPFVSYRLLIGKHKRPAGHPRPGRDNPNASDKTLNNELLTNISKHMTPHGLKPSAFVYVADSAFETNVRFIVDTNPISKYKFD